MAQLIFKGPFHFSQLKSLQLKDKAGIYVWGFAYDLDTNGQLNEFIDFSVGKIPVPEVSLNEKNEPIGCDFKGLNWKFIPYYVGKHESSLENRLIEHHLVTIGNGLKYTRLRMNHYKDFFKNIPILNKGKNSKKINQVKLYPYINLVEYFNDDCILKAIYQGVSPIEIKTVRKNKPDEINYPINLQKYIGNDTLDEIVNGNNNFWFCYAEITSKNNHDIKSAEPFTFYCLKGKTISQTKKYSFGNNKSNYPHVLICEETCECIFNLNPISKEGIPQDPNDKNSFPGY
jgi:hypothetical protein